MHVFRKNTDNPFIIPLQNSELWQRYSREELIEDLDYMAETMKEVHPDLFFSRSEEDAARFLEELREQLTEGLSRSEFYCHIAPYAAKFNDGHTMVQIPYEEYMRSDEIGDVRFPFNVKCSPGKMELNGSVLEEFESLSGKMVLSINGKPADILVDEMISMLSGESLDFRYGHLSCLFPKLLFLLTGGAEEYLLELAETGKVTVPGISRFESLKDKADKNELTTEPYSFEVLQEKKCGVLTLLRCEDEERFRSFIQDVFTIIARKKVEYLVIDIRHNGGGSSSIADELIAYLTDKPIHQFSGMKMKISGKIKKLYAWRYRKDTKFPRNLIPPSLLWEPLRKPSGSFLSVSVGKKAPPERNPRFTGKVFVITGRITYSAASSLASMIKAAGLGILVGEPTGGYSSCYGDVFSFSLPNTKILCGVSHKFFMGPDGSSEPAPTYPDFNAADFGIDLYGSGAIAAVISNLGSFV